MVMSDAVVVVGAGYAGTGVVNALEAKDAPIDLTWISDTPYHEVKHESHRIIRQPDLADGLRIPIHDIISDETSFRAGQVVAVDPERQEIRLASEETVAYDYLVLTVGARTAFYGIPGLTDRAYLLETIDDALAINHQLQTFAQDGISPRVVIGGGGLSGVQIAGEIAAWAEDTTTNVDLRLVEALDSILPNAAPALQDRVVSALRDRDVEIQAGHPIVEVSENRVHLDEASPAAFDLLIWAGGITGRSLADEGQLDKKRHRLAVNRRFRTSDDRVFALGDAALIEQGNAPAPPTAQAAWQAAPVAADNVHASITGGTLSNWTFDDKGTLVSIGDEALAYGVKGVPLEVFGSVPAATLKKVVAARWIADVSTYRRAARLWSAL